MSHPFYPFVENDGQTPSIKQTIAQVNDVEHTASVEDIRYAARIAVFDDLAAAPRVEVIEPASVRDYLSSITTTVDKLAKEQGGTISFAVIREIVENYIHAYFIEPTISILDGGNTIRFSDQGPGIKEKDRALEVGTTSATDEMKKYIRGVGSGLPYVQEYLSLKGGSLTIEDNLHEGTVVTISMRSKDQLPEAATDKKASIKVKVDTVAAGMQPIYVIQGGQTPTVVSPLPVSAPSQQERQISPSARGEAILSYLAEHEYVGPTDLSREYGESQPTWHRELKRLEEQGLLQKKGQKRVLTEKGRTALSAM